MKFAEGEKPIQWLLIITNVAYFRLMFKFLSSVYPHETTPRAIARSAALVGFVVFVALALLSNGVLYFGKNAIGIAFEFGLVTCFSSIFIGLIANGLQIDWYKEQNWNVGKEFIMQVVHLLFIGFANMVYAQLRYPSDLSHLSYLQWLGTTCLVGIAPIAISILVNLVRLQRKHGSVAQTLEEHIHSKPPTDAPSLITLNGTLANETIQIPRKDLLALEAADNYVLVHQRNGAKLSSTMLRSTLKRISEQIAGYPEFVPCHRSFMVNCDQVQHISGNAAGLRLTLMDGVLEVPVSRNLVDRFKERMNS